MMTTIISPTIYLLAAVTFAAGGQICVKKGINLLGNIDFTAGLVQTYMKLFSSPLVMLGTLSYTFSVFIWLYVLTKVNLSYAAPFLALTYVLFMVGSWGFLDETIPVSRWVGIAIISVGLIIAAKN